MNKQEYMNQLKKKLKHLSKEDFDRAIEYYEEYFAEAGEENEQKAAEDLGSPQEAAEQIIRDTVLNYSKEPVKNVRKGMSGLWTAFLAMCALPLALPLLFAGIILIISAVIVVWALLLTLLLAAVCAVIAGPVIVAAGFTVITKSIPVCLTCIGLGLFFTGAGAALTMGVYHLCRFVMGRMLKAAAGIIQKGGKRHAEE